VSTLFLVHAHPDDESIGTGGVMLRAKRAGHRVVLVTCTRGEEGEIHNLPGGETLRDRLGEIRTQEMLRAGSILGLDRQEFLGYRDSGMAGIPSNLDPRSFHQAPLEESAERLARLLREERPEVVVTYTADGTYGHPDHIKAHQTTLAALALVSAEGWEPEAVYLHAIPQSAVAQMEARARELGVVTPPAMALRGTPDAEIALRVDVRKDAATKLSAFTAHVSQNAPDSPLRGMGEEILEAALGTEAFVRWRGPDRVSGPDDDLFSGLEAG